MTIVYTVYRTMQSIMGAVDWEEAHTPDKIVVVHFVLFYVASGQSLGFNVDVVNKQAVMNIMTQKTGYRLF